MQYKPLISRTFYTNQTKKSGPCKVHSPLPAHCRVASKASSCTCTAGRPAALFLHPAGRPASSFPAH